MKLIFCHISKIWKFNNPCDVIKLKLGQKGIKFIYYIPPVIKNSNPKTKENLLIFVAFFKLRYFSWFFFSRSNLILEMCQKRPKFVHLVLLVKKSQNA